MLLAYLEGIPDWVWAAIAGGGGGTAAGVAALRRWWFGNRRRVKVVRADGGEGVVAIARAQVTVNTDDVRITGDDGLTPLFWLKAGVHQFQVCYGVTSEAGTKWKTVDVSVTVASSDHIIIIELPPGVGT